MKAFKWQKQEDHKFEATLVYKTLSPQKKEGKKKRN
jgi:hypothetical protein